MEWHCMKAEELLSSFGTDPHKGLSTKQHKKYLNQWGPNKIQEGRHDSILVKFFSQFRDFMVIILLIAAAISFLISLFGDKREWADPIIILVIVTMNAIMGTVQEYKAEKAIEALKKMAAPRAKVRRNGAPQVVRSEEIVPGDLLLLEPGDFVAADARIVESVDLKAEESSLTGESFPVSKNSSAANTQKLPVGDRFNMVYSSTAITSGRGTAVVVETGMNTEVGKIARMIGQDQSPQTPLQKRLKQTGKVLGITVILICILIFFMGIIQKAPPFEMFMIAVSLSVAAIPEGLPAIVTIVLALGVQRMVKSHSIIRKLPAVETLGSATVICSDKTGTLTQNKMTVMEISGVAGKVSEKSDFGAQILRMGALCSNAERTSGKGGKFIGDPTEIAILEAYADAGHDLAKDSKRFERIGEIPFDSSRKRMSTIHKEQNGGYRVITKGAPDVLLKRCTHYDDGKKTKPLQKEILEQLYGINEDMAKRALRVLGVAYRIKEKQPSAADSEAVERDLVFCGLIGMIDPPRPEAAEAVMMCRKAGIKPVMITGDHLMTACAIARQIGILDADDEVVSGDTLDRMTQDQLEDRVLRYSVFARVSPESKLKIVKALQKKGSVVAMTGDGVNDAPALKAADIGCAMGITGTDVAKGASDMILTDDNFASIVRAVREGRGIYDNIKKAVHFLLSSNIGEIITILVAFLLGIPSPLLPIQLLWINLVTDSLPAIALGVEGIDSEIMNRKPTKSRESLFAHGLWFHIITEGCLIGALALLAFLIGRSCFDSGPVPFVGRTMAFCVLSFSELIHAFGMRSERSLFDIGLTSNKVMLAAFAICAALQTAVIMIPPIASLFKVVSLSAGQWQIVAALSLVPLAAVELEKGLHRTRRKKNVRRTAQ